MKEKMKGFIESITVDAATFHNETIEPTYEAVKKEFNKCAREHLNSPEIAHRLYREGLSQNEFTGQLSEVIYPVYQAAKNCGFKNWEYESAMDQ